MSILKSIEVNHFGNKVKRGWDKTFWFFDIHGTILKPNYEYGNIPTEFYPHAKETLQYLTTLEDVVMVLYTCSHPHEIDQYVELFKQNNIEFKYINENPEVKTQVDGYGCYDKKPYINVLFEDKCGFDPEVEWEGVIPFMVSNYGEINK
jgi:hypothetical protein